MLDLKNTVEHYDAHARAGGNRLGSGNWAARYVGPETGLSARGLAHTGEGKHAIYITVNANKSLSN